MKSNLKATGNFINACSSLTDNNNNNNNSITKPLVTYRQSEHKTILVLIDIMHWPIVEIIMQLVREMRMITNAQCYENLKQPP